MTAMSKKEPSHKRLLKIFVDNLKKNTLALKELKTSIDTKHKRNDNYERIIEITNSVNEKLDGIRKLRNDIKIYKTINTILTNHYIKETKNHENSVQAKMMKLEVEVKQSYQDLKEEFSKMTAILRVATHNLSNINVASQNNSLFQNMSSQIKDSNVFVIGNDFRSNQFNELYIRNEMYNNIIKKIDKLFCGMVSLDKSVC